MKIVIDEERCTGNGRCYVVAPALFTDDERGYGQVVGDGTVPAGLEDLARTAVAACPEDAVSLQD